MHLKGTVVRRLQKPFLHFAAQTGRERNSRRHIGGSNLFLLADLIQKKGIRRGTVWIGGRRKENRQPYGRGSGSKAGARQKIVQHKEKLPVMLLFQQKKHKARNLLAGMKADSAKSRRKRMKSWRRLAKKR